MSLFGFADIVFNKTNSPLSGPLKSLEENRFSTSTLRYPEDVGNYDKGHYVIFYIREQEITSFPTKAGYMDDTQLNQLNGTNPGTNGFQFQNFGLPVNQATNLGSDLLNKLNSGLTQLNGATGGALSSVTGTISSAAGSIQSSINNLFGQKATSETGDSASTQSVLSNNIARIDAARRLIKTTKLTKEAIALYMPDTLLYQSQQNYSDLNLGGELGGQAIAAAATAKSSGVIDAIKAAAGKISQEVLNRVLGSQSTAALINAAAGVVQNPLLELIYTSPAFRTFQFDFVFYPRNEKEAIEVQKIIDSLRFHQSPEIGKLKNFLVAPSEFDIRFYYGGRENPNIPQISTCVLSDIQLNYAPNGFTAYEIPGQSTPSLGGTGMPVSIQMSLTFKETVFLTKDDFGRPKSAASATSSGTVPVTGADAQTWTDGPG